MFERFIPDDGHRQFMMFSASIYDLYNPHVHKICSAFAAHPLRYFVNMAYSARSLIHLPEDAWCMAS